MGQQRCFGWCRALATPNDVLRLTKSEEDNETCNVLLAQRTRSTKTMALKSNPRLIIQIVLSKATVVGGMVLLNSPKQQNKKETMPPTAFFIIIFPPRNVTINNPFAYTPSVSCRIYLKPKPKTNLRSMALSRCYSARGGEGAPRSRSQAGIILFLFLLSALCLNAFPQIPPTTTITHGEGLNTRRL